MIRIDAMWLACVPVDIRAGADRLLATVVQVFGAAQAHHGYLFANARGTRIKLLVHDDFGAWCASRRLNQGPFQWPTAGSMAPMHWANSSDLATPGMAHGARDRQLIPSGLLRRWWPRRPWPFDGTGALQ